MRIGAERIGEIARLPQRDELAVAALLHDVGKLVLAELYGDERAIDDRGEPPDERARRERRELGIDHALVGAVLVRRWGMPPIIAGAVERHHSPDATGHAAAIRLADMVVHHAAGDPVSAEAMRAVATGARARRRRRSAHCCSSSRTRASGAAARPSHARSRCARSTPLRGLAEGKVYKQIAQELSLSVSTVRTHLHNVYRKIGAVDRAQAVLLARDRGWL